MKNSYLYNVGDIVNEKLEILELIKITKKQKPKDTYVKGYMVRCLECGYKHEKRESHLKEGVNCPCCCPTPRVVVKGINDIATTHPHLVKYFANPEDATKVTYGSGKKILVKCPDCGFEKMMVVSNLSRQGFSCNKCGDGISFPNKFVTNALMQLNINIELEKVFNWSNGKKFDIYIPTLNIIIENHGGQHYEKGFESCGGKTLEKEQENDMLKKELASKNGIEYYIELDCRKSEMDWIKQSIMNSQLPKLLNFKEENIDWLKCEEYCATNLVKIVCEIFENGIKDTPEIAKITRLSISAVRNYLKTGKKLGWCNYDATIVNHNRRRKIGKANSKKVYMYDLNKNFIGEFSSCSELDRQSEELFGIKLDYRNISSVCVGKRSQHKGYIFSYTKLE